MGIVKYPAICLCLVIATSPVLAQEVDPVQKEQPRLSRQLSPEERQAAWEMEAIGFSHNLTLSDEASTQVVRAYTNSRKRLQEAIENTARGGTDDSSGRKGPAMAGNTAQLLTQLMNRERIRLRENLRPLLAQTQLKHAMLTLASFNHDWDRMVHTILGFALSPDKTLVALSPIEVFIARLSETQRRGDSRADMQLQLQTLRHELLNSMSSLLDVEQIRIFRLVADAVMIQTWQNAPRNSIRNDKNRKSNSDPKQSPLPRKLSRYDADGDGKLTREELPEFLHPLLNQLDANKDDMLDAEELKDIKARNG